MLVRDKDYYKRLTGQINASYKIRPWLEVGTSNTLTSTTSSSAGSFSSIVYLDPLTPVYYDSDNLPTNVQAAIDNGLSVVMNDKGQVYGLSYLQTSLNPLGALEVSDSRYKSQNVNGTTWLNLTPIKNFVFTSRLGYSLNSSSSKSYTPTYWENISATGADTTNPSLSQYVYTTRYYQWENFFNYTLETKRAGNFSIMAGMSYSDNETDYAGGQTNELSSYEDNFIYLDYSTNTADDYVSGSTSYQRKLAYYGRFSWDFLGRYNVQANFRADSYDTAYLDFDHKWGYFPSVSLGWTFSKEDFLEQLVGETFTYGKLRASYGVNGSISNLGGYAYAATLKAGIYYTSINMGTMTYSIDDELVTGVYPNTVQANPKLRWERSKQFDVGVDLRFFKDRLALTVDWYYKKTDGLLVQTTAMLMSGYQTVYKNVGEIVNKGFDVELDWKDHIGSLTYGVKANISILKNKVTKYLGEGTRISGYGMTYFEEGYPIWYMRGYKYLGTDSSTGEAIYADLNNDGDYTSDGDYTQVGNALPDFTYGITLTAAWKGFDLNIYGTGTYGNDLVYGMVSSSASGYLNRPLFLYYDRWTETNTEASLPSATYMINSDRLYSSDLIVKNGSFFRIKQIQLGYTLPKSVLNALTLTQARAFISLDNFFTFTSYPGPDPEVYTYGLGVDYGGYPNAKSVMFGFNIAF